MTALSEQSSGPVEPAHDTGSANDNDPFCCAAFSSAAIESPVARYNCCKYNKETNCYYYSIERDNYDGP